MKFQYTTHHRGMEAARRSISNCQKFIESSEDDLLEGALNDLLKGLSACKNKNKRFTKVAIGSMAPSLLLLINQLIRSIGENVYRSFQLKIKVSN